MRILNSVRFGVVCQEVARDAEKLMEAYRVLSADLVPTDAEFLRAIKENDDFKRFMDESKARNRAAMGFMPRQMIIDLATQYNAIYERCAESAVTAGVVLRKNYIFKTGEDGLTVVDVSATQEKLKGTCYDVVDVEKLRAMCDAFSQLHNALKHFDEECHRLEIPHLDRASINGWLLPSSQYQNNICIFKFVNLQDDLRDGKLDPTSIEDYALMRLKTYICSPYKPEKDD